MDVTIFQINGRVLRFSNVVIVMDYDEYYLKIWLEDDSLKTFKKDLIAQIKIGGQHEYKKG